MARRRRRRSQKRKQLKLCLSLAAIVLVLIAGMIAAHLVEDRMSVKVENAGEQLTAHTKEENTAQVFMNGQWYEKRNVETLLVMGIDNFGSIASSSSYNNPNQADFLVLFVTDKDTGKNAAIHINRDTMTDITILGVTGETVGTRYAQMALSYNYGSGKNDSCRNTANAVSRLLYGVPVDRYIAVTMDAVPILNDWAGGVEIEVLHDFSPVSDVLVKGEKIKLHGDMALTYVRTRSGLEDSSNLTRMERQRQYAAQWHDAAKGKLGDEEAIADLVLQMSDHHYSDCSIDELAYYAEKLGEADDINVQQLPGEAIRGEQFMEYYVDDEQVQQIVLDLFYKPVY